MKKLKSSTILLILHLVPYIHSSEPAESLYVSTEYGPIQGTYLNASDNRLLAAFLGVPFARPPIGSLRFRPPQDPLPWQSIRYAVKNPPSCFQRQDFFFADFEGAKEYEPAEEPSEDCLYLNIYVPDVVNNVNANASSDGLPVLVWFHGGSFAQGSAFPKGAGNWKPDPREIAVEGGVIVVTVQYRLGSFGFLFLDDEAAPGNVGLLDQRKSLEWITRNIFAFGGDPTKVTLAGQDAGGVSAALQLIVNAKTDQNKLFQKLILHSAGLRHPWSYVEPTEAFRRALKLASLLGCPATGTKEDVVLCMTKKTAEEIGNKEMGVADPRIHFSPFVMTRDGSFLTAKPEEMFERFVRKEARQMEMKMMMGGQRGRGDQGVDVLPALHVSQ